jgi:hypothetical protein
LITAAAGVVIRPIVRDQEFSMIAEDLGRGPTTRSNVRDQGLFLITAVAGVVMRPIVRDQEFSVIPEDLRRRDHPLELP